MRTLAFRIHSVFEQLLWLPMTTLLLCLIAVGYWSVDRAAPATYLGDQHARVFLITDERLLMTHKIERHRTDCDVTVNRWLSFADKARYYFPAFEIRSKALTLLSEESPNEVRVFLDVPGNFHVGDQGMYGVQLSYVCNPVHRIFPVEISYVVRFTVEPLYGGREE